VREPLYPTRVALAEILAAGVRREAAAPQRLDRRRELLVDGRATRAHLDPDGRDGCDHWRSSREHRRSHAGLGRVGRTAYAAERAVTGYLDHYRDLRPSAAMGGLTAARAHQVLEGTDDTLKSKAHARLMLLRR
jgi:hypothetical protein